MRTGKGAVRAVAGAAAVVVIIVGLVLLHRFVWQGGQDPLVVYCAHDSVYSESILRAFEETERIPLSVKFDTEATKSLGLVELLVSEKDRPRCDVFWNNELLGTMDLQQRGILQPYRGPGYQRIPAAFRDPDGYWTGFGARLRVYVVNTDNMPATREAVDQVLDGDLSRVTIAKPLYGTTLTQYSVLWHLWGGDRLKQWHADWRDRGVQEVMGNAQTRNLVADGVCDVGLTDTDDFFSAKDDGKPVDALPVRVENDATICIPNTVSIIKGTDRLSDARKLVDYLLSARCELALANSRSRQIPLGPVDEGSLPKDVIRIRGWAQAGLPLGDIGPARTACLNWLKEEYGQ